MKFFRLIFSRCGYFGIEILAQGAILAWKFENVKDLNWNFYFQKEQLGNKAANSSQIV